MSLYPLFLKLAGRRCLVVGGGAVAARKVLSLLKHGAHVVVVGPEISSEIDECGNISASVDGSNVEIRRKNFEPSDIDGATIAIAATNDRAVNESVAKAGRERGILVNVVDDPELCDFYVPSSVDRGELQIAISTGGTFPALAKHLRVALERQFGPEYGAYVELLGRFRQEAKARIGDPKQRVLAEEAFLDSSAFALVAEGRHEDAAAALDQCLAKFGKEHGAKDAANRHAGEQARPVADPLGRRAPEGTLRRPPHRTARHQDHG